MAKLKSNNKNKNQLLLANDAQYPSSPDKRNWMNEIYIPQNPKPGDVLFNEEELPGGAKQLGFEWLVKQLLIKKNKKLANVDYSGIPNKNDLKIKAIMGKYGKDPNTGKYKDANKLIEALKLLKEA